MATNSCDVVVIGLGPGGEAVATELAKAGLSVVAVDERLVGGECPYFGCIPSKMIIRASDVLEEGRRIPEFAGESDVRPDWSEVADRIRDEATDDWNDQVAVDRLVDAGATFVRGHGRIIGPRTVQVGDDTYEASKGVVLNPGTSPSAPPIDGLADTPYWTNREILRVESVPGSLAVIGGGPIGAELAQGMSRFGVRVTVIEVGERILGPEEPESSKLVADVFAHEGIQVLTGVTISSVSYDDGRFRIVLDGQEIDAEKLLVAAGRRANLTDLGLETVGLDPAAHSLEVDERMRAGEGLWALGDVVGHGAFTHVSMYQSAILVRDILGQDGPTADYRALPHVTFTDPEVGSVGMTEKQARDAGLNVRVGLTDLASSTRGWIAKGQGLIKLVEDADRGVLVGATAAGPSGGEILGMLTTAVHAEVPTDTLKSMIYAYPTFHRAVESALKDLS
ncbi:MAG: FAD-dependent pyridine nucleotide-disulfide oxidoreductase [Marmoricola sp.]|jgi:pyruvate/2-oxoglutarate dehydrogenase complex dihydrolipoamide dehydrogenase (E3) component|nr:FAD-dependent pyridine nucleotide-disulfide oxidoreductase [Marmoricola sp.]